MKLTHFYVLMVAQLSLMKPLKLLNKPNGINLIFSNYTRFKKSLGFQFLFLV